MVQLNSNLGWEVSARGMDQEDMRRNGRIVIQTIGFTSRRITKAIKAESQRYSTYVAFVEILQVPRGYHAGVQLGIDFA